MFQKSISSTISKNKQCNIIQKTKQSNRISKIKSNQIYFEANNQQDKIQQLIQSKYKFSQNKVSLNQKFQFKNNQQTKKLQSKNNQQTKKLQSKNNQQTKKFQSRSFNQHIFNSQKTNLQIDLPTDYYKSQNKYRRTHKEYQNCINRINLRTTYRGFNIFNKQNIKNVKTDQEKNIIIFPQSTSKEQINLKYTNRIINFIIKRGIGKIKTKNKKEQLEYTSDNELQTKKMYIKDKNSYQSLNNFKQHTKITNYLENEFKPIDIQPW